VNFNASAHGTIEYWFHTCVVIIGATVLGAIVLSGIVRVSYAILDPTATKDAQFELSYILSLPIGTFLGGALGVALINPQKAGLLLSIVGGLTVSLCLGIGFLSAGSRELTLQGFLLTIASIWCLVPLVASSAILARGIYLLRA
jgi:hypothetical protein